MKVSYEDQTASFYWFAKSNKSKEMIQFLGIKSPKESSELEINFTNSLIRTSKESIEDRITLIRVGEPDLTLESSNVLNNYASRILGAVFEEYENNGTPMNCISSLFQGKSFIS